MVEWDQTRSVLYFSCSIGRHLGITGGIDQTQWELLDEDVYQTDKRKGAMTISLKPEHEQLLQNLAQESRETPEELLARLIQKENFSRHYEYDALSGKTTNRQCMSRECFLKMRY